MAVEAGTDELALRLRESTDERVPITRISHDSSPHALSNRSTIFPAVEMALHVPVASHQCISDTLANERAEPNYSAEEGEEETYPSK